MSLVRTYPSMSPEPGLTRQVLSQSPEMMVVSFTFEEGAQGPLHSHPHIQATYVETGRFRFTVDGDSFDVGPGDSFVIQSGARHACLCLAACRHLRAPS